MGSPANLHEAGVLVAALLVTTPSCRKRARWSTTLCTTHRVHKDVELGLGAGPGLTSGAGTPVFRGVFSVAYTPEQVEPKRVGAADRDGDKIPDALDACPDAPGVSSTDPKAAGCPKDEDGDGIADAVDACPHEEGQSDPSPAKNGCPRHVRVTAEEILLLNQMEFDTAKTTIRPVSAQLLDEMAQVLKDHPEFRLLDVQGHTDAQGTRELNAALSQGRAEAVRTELVRRGIAALRLRAKGCARERGRRRTLRRRRCLHRCRHLPGGGLRERRASCLRTRRRVPGGRHV